MMRWKPGFALGLALVFLVLAGAVASRHEMWRDEAQAWMLARDSASPLEIVKRLKYEPHPSVWYLTLFPLTRISPFPYMMQAWHLVIAAVNVYLFARYAPFTKTQKALFAFGYFPFYEYAVISRNYAVGVTFLFLICAAWPSRAKRLPWIGLLVLLACHTSLHALILGVAIAAALLLDLVFGSERPPRSHVALGFVLIALGAASAVYQLWPPWDRSIDMRWRFGWNPAVLWQTLGTVTRAYLPVPGFRRQFWETNILEHCPNSDLVIGVAGLFLLLGGILYLAKRPVSLVPFAVGTAGLCAFAYTKSLGGIRHHGHLFILLLVAAWIGPSLSEKCDVKFLSRWTGGRVRRALSGCMTGLLAVHVLAGTAASAIDWQRPFSQSRRAARFIREHGMEHMPIMGHERANVSSVAAYLNARFYYPRGDRVASFAIWDKRGDRRISIDYAMRRARSLYSEDVLLISSLALGPSALRQYSVRKVAEFRGALVPTEDYWLYVIPRGQGPAALPGPAPRSGASAPAKPVKLRAHAERVNAATPKGFSLKEVTYRKNSIGIELVAIPAGDLLMGSTTGHSDEKPVHRVRIPRPFHIAAYEVTQRQYERIMGLNPSYFRAPQLPVERVTWHDAREFCRRLSRLEGISYRLPTEAEWEYACRAGSRARHYWGDYARDDCAWVAYNSRFRTHPVARKAPNAFGLFDMCGNVREWCESPVQRYPLRTDAPPKVVGDAGYRVMRGGGWSDLDSRTTSSYRSFFAPTHRDIFIGFRVAADLSPAKPR